jgi:hypothetical protein
MPDSTGFKVNGRESLLLSATLVGQNTREGNGSAQTHNAATDFYRSGDNRDFWNSANGIGIRTGATLTCRA